MIAEIHKPKKLEHLEFVVQEENGDEILLNQFGDRRFVFKQQDPRHPQVKRTAFQGMNLYGEWVELMEVIEEQYPQQDPFYTVGVFVVTGPKDPDSTLLTQYTYGNDISGWEEGYRRCISGNPQTALSDLQEMNAAVRLSNELPLGIDVEATVRTFYEQVERKLFTTPSLLRTDYTSEK